MKRTLPGCSGNPISPSGTDAARRPFFGAHWPWQVLLPFALFVLHAMLFAGWLADGLAASGPLWNLLDTPLSAVSPAGSAWPVKVVSLALVFPAFLAVNRMTESLIIDPVLSRLATFAILACLAINTSLVTWTTSGLENPLYLLLATGYGMFCLRYLENDVRAGMRIAWWAGLCTAGLALTRPEAVLFMTCFPFIVVLQRLLPHRGTPPLGAGLARFLAGALLALPACLVADRNYLDNIYPDGPGLTRHVRDGLADLVADMFVLPVEWVGAGLTLAIVVVVIRSPLRVYFVALLVLTVAAAASYLLSPADRVDETRFATPFFALFTTLLAVLITEMTLLVRGLTFSARAGIMAGLLGLLIVQSVFLYPPRSRAFAENPPPGSIPAVGQSR